MNSYVIDSPQPSNISYWWNLGSLLAVCLIIQLATGIFLAMHYSSNINLAFYSVQHIMMDVNYGWVIRYCHSNGAAFFFIFVYMHMARGLYYGSYRSPRIAVWYIGVVIFLLLIITGFLGYCLVYGQMSHWGYIFLASNVIFIIITHQMKKDPIPLGWGYVNYSTRPILANKKTPLSEDILSIIYGSLLGDATAEKRKGGKATRIVFYQENTHEAYLLHLHRLVSDLGYTSNNIPQLKTRLGKHGKIRKYIRFNTWSYTSLNSIFDEWYKNVNDKKIKIVPSTIYNHLTPLALSIWIMDDGCKLGKGLKIATNSFSYKEVIYLSNILLDRYDIKSTVQKTGVENQYHIYVWAESMPLLWDIVREHIIPSMKYKFGDYCK